MLVRKASITIVSGKIQAQANSYKGSWDESLEDAAKKGTTVPIYRACKIEGERQAWKWVEKNQPKFELNSVLPWLTVSPIRQKADFDVI